ncbi:MAG: type II toxin-antitoxin system RelE/ParE family toxin [Candidatus Sulfotelmatobacter sp.]
MSRRKPKTIFNKIWRYLLTETGLAVADKIQGELVNAFEGLAEAHDKGHKRPDLTKRDVLFFTEYQYMIVYRRAATVQIVAVLHGKRDVKRILKTRLSR